ncbi:MAG: hypothetical protein EBS29_04375, partial [Chloroflexia bacterium]|nr:hypothetical protein [Chloroflexia bacterium]
IGIQPDAIVLRSDRDIPDGVKKKISLMCDVDSEACVAASDAPSIYDIPKVLHREGLDAYVVRRLGMPFRDVDWSDWDQLLNRVHHPKHELTVALVGKYVGFVYSKGDQVFLGDVDTSTPGVFADVAQDIGELQRNSKFDCIIDGVFDMPDDLHRNQADDGCNTIAIQPQIIKGGIARHS